MLIRIFLFFSAFIASTALYIAVQVYVDGASVFPQHQATSWDRKKPINIADHIRPNLRIQRLRHVLNNLDKYDSIWFGSSRVGAADLSRLKGSALDGNWYRLSYSSGTIEEHLINLRHILDAGGKLKTVVVGIDDFSFSVPPFREDNNFYEYPLLTGWSGYWQMARIYLLKPWKERDFEILFGRYERKPQENPGLDEGVIGWENVTWNPRPEGEVLTAESHLEKMRKIRGDGTGRAGFKYAAFYQEHYAEFVQECQTHNIECIFYTVPTYYKTFLNADIQGLYAELGHLNQITPYYDFWGVNANTTDHSKWIEASHHFPIVHDPVMDLIGSRGAKNEFGQLVPINTDAEQYLKNKIAETQKMFAQYLAPDEHVEIDSAFRISSKGLKTIALADVPATINEGEPWGNPGMILFSKSEMLTVSIPDDRSYHSIDFAVDSNDAYEVILEKDGVELAKKVFGPAIPDNSGTKRYVFDLGATYQGGSLRFNAVSGDQFLSLGFLVVN